MLYIINVPSSEEEMRREQLTAKGAEVDVDSLMEAAERGAQGRLARDAAGSGVRRGISKPVARPSWGGRLLQRETPPVGRNKDDAPFRCGR